MLKNHPRRKKTFKSFILIAIFAVVFLNIVASQTIHPLYFDFIDERREAGVIFLQKIRNESFFPLLYQEQQKIYGGNLHDEVFVDDVRRRNQIDKLETLLQKNPKATEVLTLLSRLYNEGGNTEKAKEYGERANSIDPSINF